MIVINQNNKWAKTLYASCPQQALSFYDNYKNQKFPTLEAWENLFHDYQAGWECDEEDFD